MNIRREWVTPITAGAFLLMAVTGVLIFFHADTGANKAVHEWLGWVLLAGAALHTAANFAGLKRHLATRRGQLVVGAFAAALLVSFASIGDNDEPPFAPPIRALSQVPLTTLAQVAQITPAHLREHLAKAGVQPTSDQQSLSDLVGTDAHRQMHVLEKVFTATD